MKKVLSLALIMAVGAAVMFTGCVPPNGDVSTPTGLTVEATTDGAGVKLTWNAVTVEGEDVTYDVSFDGTLLLDEITALEYTHTAPGKAGEYEVIAVAGSEESDPAKFSTDPITVATLQVWELNGSGSSGIGFDVTNKAVVTYSMATDAEKTHIDCYFTNWLGQSGGFGGEYDLCSPAENLQDDPGKPFTEDVSGWHTTGISDDLVKNIDAVDMVDSTGYYSRPSVPVAEGGTYAIYTQDGYYGLIQAVSISTANGAVDIKATLQTIKGLRLF